MEGKKFVQTITSRDDDFAKWYTDVVTKAKLCEYTSLKGMMVYMPNGYAIWENIQKLLDKRFKDSGVKNVYMPMLIPESLLNKEKEHVEGFAPEVAWVTVGGKDNLEERLCIRPTSEVLFCEHWKKNVNSYRDLPMVYNQWCSVLRWEKTTRPFLRSKEFLWQEGHTLHATSKEAERRCLDMLEIYTDFVEKDLAMPVIYGKKTPSEKFAGAVDTYTIEALMHDGKVLQSGTSHYFGDGFTKAFDIKYVDKDNKLVNPYQTSWGLSTRLIGGIIMVHGDDDGIVLPPHIAPTKAMIIPIGKDPIVELMARKIHTDLKLKMNVEIDLSNKTPGYKFSNQEMLGIPLRIEVGQKDLEKGIVTVVRRDTRQKLPVKLDDVVIRLPLILETMQKDMYIKAKENLDNHIFSAKTIDEMNNILNEKGGFVKAMWCGDSNCEDEVKAKTNGATIRCIPEEQEQISDKCICCGKKAKHMVYFGKAY